MPELKAVIFDCDGVLVDTEFLKFQAWQESLAKHGVEFRLEEYIPLVGLSSKEILGNIPAAANLPIDAAAFIQAKNERYQEIQHAGVPIFPSAVNFLKHLLENKNEYKIKVALASSGSRAEITENLKQMGIIPDLFDAIASGRDDLKHIQDSTGTNKPKPYIYQLVCAQLGVNSEECIAFEDSNAGIISATSAGIEAIAVPNLFTERHDFSTAKFILTFDNLTFDKLSDYFSTEPEPILVNPNSKPK